jgi:hypothetical protein
MLTISAPKVAGFTPRWAPFPGFSLLFDSLGTPYRREGVFETLACDVAHDPALGFYRRVYEGFARFNFDRLLNTYLFCSLPPESYHVTAFDVANQGDLTRCRADCLDSLRELLAQVPDNGWSMDYPLLSPVYESSLSTQPWNLRLRYGKLDMFGRGGISLQLCGADDESIQTLERFREARAELSKNYQERFGVGAGARFSPHLSIGYFANAEGAELASGHIAGWDARLQEYVGDEVLTFETASLHAFTSMETFIRRAAN